MAANNVAGINIVANAIVVNNSGFVQSQNNLCNNSYLLHINQLKNNIARVLPSENAESAGFLSLYDDASNLKFITASAGTHDFDFTFPSAIDINAMACAGGNMQSAGVTWEFYTYDAGLTTFVKRADGSGKRDNSPAFNTFDTVTTNKVRFRFICSQPFEIGELSAGLALRLPVPPSIGYAPARWNSNNKINTGQTEANTFSRSTVLQRGASESATFENVDTDWLDQNWTSVLDTSGNPVWFSGDQKLKPNDVIYGHINTSGKPSYTNSFYSTVKIDIDGAK